MFLFGTLYLQSSVTWKNQVEQNLPYLNSHLECLYEPGTVLSMEAHLLLTATLWVGMIIIPNS